MWIRRSDPEIAAYHAEEGLGRKSLKRPLLWASVWTVLTMFAHYIGFRGSLGAYYPITQASGFSWPTVAAGGIVFVLAFILIYYRQRRGLAFFDALSSSRLCGDCQEASPPNIESLCPCGGTLDPFEYYRWEEDDETPQQLDMGAQV